MKGRRWSEQELIVAFALYCQTSFGRIHYRNPRIIAIAEQIGRTPSALAMKMVNFASLDPDIINSGRRGLGNASAKDKHIWDEFHRDWQTAVSKAQAVLEYVDAADNDAQDYRSKNVRTTTYGRRRQSFFRNSVLSSYANTCCVSGVILSGLLVASHIVPWNVDAENRLNPRNGLCLSVLYDRVFDIGLITVTTDYKIRVSEVLKAKATSSFSVKNLHFIDGKRISLPEKFLPKREFLDYHNNEIFKL